MNTIIIYGKMVYSIRSIWIAKSIVKLSKYYTPVKIFDFSKLKNIENSNINYYDWKINNIYLKKSKYFQTKIKYWKYYNAIYRRFSETKAFPSNC